MIVFSNHILLAFSLYDLRCIILTIRKQIAFKKGTIDQLEEIVNSVLLNISDWLTANTLALNTSKSNFMIIKPRQRKLSKNVKLKIDNEILQESKCVKYLGVLISKNQTWKEYIQF